MLFICDLGVAGVDLGLQRDQIVVCHPLEVAEATDDVTQHERRHVLVAELGWLMQLNVHN